MKKSVDIDILEGIFEISVYKITRKEKEIYNAVAKLVEGKNNVKQR
jgi:hypothetical protein